MEENEKKRLPRWKKEKKKEIRGIEIKRKKVKRMKITLKSSKTLNSRDTKKERREDVNNDIKIEYVPLTSIDGSVRVHRTFSEELCDSRDGLEQFLSSRDGSCSHCSTVEADSSSESSDILLKTEK